MENMPKIKSNISNQISNNQMYQRIDLPKILDMSIKYGKYAKYPKLNMSTASNE